MRTRLVYTAYNRPDYFTQVMQSWAQVRGYADWQPTVHLEPSRWQDAMTGIAVESGATVKLNPLRRGVLTNPWHALDTTFTDADFAVLAEDDVLVSSDVLEYFSWAAARFAADHSVLGVCAFSRSDHSDPAAVYLNDRFTSPLVWGTWSDRWPELRDTWDFDYSSGLATGTPSGWDWNIALRVGAGRRFVTPRQSRSDHIGQFNGAHMQPQDFAASRAVSFLPHRPRCVYRLESS